MGSKERVRWRNYFNLKNNYLRRDMVFTHFLQPTFYSAGKFLMTGNKYFKIVLGSSWNWLNSLGSSLCINSKDGWETLLAEMSQVTNKKKRSFKQPHETEIRWAVQKGHFPTFWAACGLCSMLVPSFGELSLILGSGFWDTAVVESFLLLYGTPNPNLYSCKLTHQNPLVHQIKPDWYPYLSLLWVPCLE